MHKADNWKPTELVEIAQFTVAKDAFNRAALFTAATLDMFAGYLWIEHYFLCLARRACGKDLHLPNIENTSRQNNRHRPEVFFLLKTRTAHPIRFKLRFADTVDLFCNFRILLLTTQHQTPLLTVQSCKRK
jgi:hypothetical protein